MWLWFLGNWKPIGLLVLIAVVAGYIRVLQYKVDSRDKTISTMEQSIENLGGDLARAKSAISALDNGIATYRSFVTRAINSIRETQAKQIAREHVFQGMLDNLSLQAREARRIEDAPIVPFFMDNVVMYRSVLVAVHGDVYTFRLLRGPLPEAADPGYGGAVLPAGHTR